MSRKGENIYKRKDGRWEGRYLKHIPGEKTCYGYVYAKTYREAKAKLLEAAAQWKAMPSASASADQYFCHIAQMWEKHAEPRVKQSTFVKYHSILEHHILPGLGDMPMNELTHQKLEDLAQQLLRTLAPRTVSDIFSVLRSILRFAKKAGVPVLCDGSSVWIRRQASETRVLTPNEQSTLCRYLLEDLSLKNAGVLLSLYTGLRVGEVCALRWDDISLDDHLLHVRHTMQRLQNLSAEGPRTLVIESAPKTFTSARTIPLPEDLVRVLLSLPGNHSGYFLTGSSDIFVEPRTMQYHFGRVTQRCGIDPINYHALRHTFATRCVELGMDVKSLSELLGHSTVTITMDRYVHPTINHKRDNMQRLMASMTANVTAK